MIELIYSDLIFGERDSLYSEIFFDMASHTYFEVDFILSLKLRFCKALSFRCLSFVAGFCCPRTEKPVVFKRGLSSVNCIYLLRRTIQNFRTQNSAFSQRARTTW